MKIALSGDSGRMGKALKKRIKKDPHKLLVSKMNQNTPLSTWDFKKIDAVIDFSLPLVFSKVLHWCVQYKKPLVSGTTGLSTKQKHEMLKASKTIPIFYSENMSWGIFVLIQCIHQILKDDVSIVLEEVHHKNKKDKPSGTALKLKKQFPKALQKKIQIKSYRKNLELGTHKIYFKTEEESILLEHKALSRDLFAKGALKALEYIVNKRKGLYSVNDIYK